MAPIHMQQRSSNIMITARRVALLALLAAFAGACSAEVVAHETQAEPLAQSFAALGSVPANAIPVPIDFTSKKSTWDGSYPELLAADALAECSMRHYVVASEGGINDSDAFLAKLSANMGKAMCADPALGSALPNPPPSAEAVFSRWIGGRRDALCNADPNTGAARAIQTAAATSEVSTLSPYGMPTPTTYQAASPAPAFSGAELGQAWNKAQNQVHYAWLNVCMAQRLREHLESIQVALASEADLLQLQSIARDRAARAVFQYTTIIKTIDASAPATAIANPWNYMALIRYWPVKDAAWSTKATRIGQDFAIAVQALIDLSQQNTETLVRTSSTKLGLGEYDSPPPIGASVSPLDSGLDGPRMDALAAAYGQATSAARRGVVTDMKAPEIASLLGLARAANALQLTGANKTFSQVTNGTNLLNAVERYVRQGDCVARGDNTTACYQIPGGLAFDQYEVRKRYNIQLAHATSLIEALLEHVYGQPGRDQFVSGGPWTYRFDTPDMLLGLPLDILERLNGTHTYSGDFSSSGGGTLTLGANTSLRQLPTAVMQSQAWGYLPAPSINFTLHPIDQGYGLRGDANFYYRYGRQLSGNPLGSQAVLAYARYVVSRSNVNALALVTAAGPKLWKLFETATGARHVVIRRQVGTTTSSSCSKWIYTPTGMTTATVPSSCTVPTDVTNASGVLVDVFYNGKSGDLVTRVARRTITNAAVQPALTALSFATETIDSSIAAVTSEVVRKVSIAIPANEVADLRLLDILNRELPLFRGKLDPPQSYANTLNVGFMPIVTFTRPAAFGRSVTYGGTLNAQIERAWLFGRNEWSRPVYDGLDMPTTWAPIGDASLHGGQVGEEAYQYFLRAAKDAGQQASSAIEKAFDTLSIESQDSLALQQAEQRGKTLSQLEEQSFCGNAAAGQSATQTSCAPTFASNAVVPPTCPAGVTGLCTSMYDSMNKLLGTLNTAGTGVLLASDVASQLTNSAPNFSRYSGGQLEGQLLAQWNAWHALQLAMTTAIATAAAGEAEVVTARAEKATADSQFKVDIANSLNTYLTAVANIASARAQAAQLVDAYGQYSVSVSAADAAIALDDNGECGDRKTKAAHDAGFTWDPWEYNGYNAYPSTLSWSEGPWIAQQERCRDAQVQHAFLISEDESKRTALSTGIAALKDQIVANNLAAYLGFPVQFATALARYEAAFPRVAAAEMNGGAMVAAQTQLVQKALGDLLAATAAIGGAANQAQVAKARIDLEKALEVAAIDNRFNLRRTYRSYDLWRARALSENARRLAVAARRAIEARFVVDLSTMRAPETFVEAPALWANEIYSPDLKPPSAVGRTAAPTNTQGLYSSKLTDYVSNLELFVNGYAIGRPSASVRSDTDVVQLPGPASIIKTVSALDDVHEYRDTNSAGWSFYCANTSTWTRNPQSATFDPGSWTLATMCGGQPPTLARLSFWLDPWGRFQDGLSNPAFSDRHNVRWRGFALNLVGSGLRDCAGSADPQACYAEPFIRYDLKHIGPALISDYDRMWVSQDIPTGVIEGGKALASEEWVDPVANGFQNPVVGNVARQEFAGRPLGGAYELTFEVAPDVRLERIDRVQLLMQTDYWVRQD